MVQSGYQPQDAARLPTRYCFIIRHGERADRAPQYRAEYANHPDAFLTPLGHQQARETGVFLMNELQKIEMQEGRSFDQVLVKTSPFVRCLATCARICKEIGVEQVKVDYNFCELMSEYLYTKNPVPHIELRKKNPADLNQDY